MRTDASKRIEFTPLKDRPLLSWNNMVSMERFLITNDAFRGWLHLNGFGIHTVATMDHKHANEFLAKKGEVVCYLNPMEVLFLVNELKVCDMSEDTFYGYHILTDSELALKLVNEACMEPKIYVRYRLHRKYYHCIVFNNFAGARFAIYKEPPSIAHAVGLCYWETDLLSIQATARVVESIKKTAIVIGTETPPVDTNVFLWFRNSYIFHDITCPLVPSLDIHFEMSAELAHAPP